MPAIQVLAARSYGVDVFLFDWYWYGEKGTAGTGGLFLDGALEDGFLAMPTTHGMQFALMWANQDWVDIHPANRGWHSQSFPVGDHGSKGWREGEEGWMVEG